MPKPAGCLMLISCLVPCQMRVPGISMLGRAGHAEDQHHAGIGMHGIWKDAQLAKKGWLACCR